MTIKECLKYKNFVVLGNTINPEKYACKIYNLLKSKGYNVLGIPNDKASINDVEEEIDSLVLCINNTLGIKYLKENKKLINFVIIQPNAGSSEIYEYLKENKIDYADGCIYKELLKG